MVGSVANIEIVPDSFSSVGPDKLHVHHAVSLLIAWIHLDVVAWPNTFCSEQIPAPLTFIDMADIDSTNIHGGLVMYLEPSLVRIGALRNRQCEQHGENVQDRPHPLFSTVFDLRVRSRR